MTALQTCRCGVTWHRCAAQLSDMYYILKAVDSLLPPCQRGYCEQLPTGWQHGHGGTVSIGDATAALSN